MAKQDLTIDDKFELLIAALAQRSGGISKDDLKEILDANSQSLQKAMKPENQFHPGISAYSYPEGDQAHPKADLPFQFFYNGFPCHKARETEHWREWELMAQVQPGEYTVVCKDGSIMTVTVKAEYNANRDITKIELSFPVSRESKHMVPPKQVLLHQVVHAGTKTPRALFVEAMAEYMNLIMGDQPVSA